MNNKMTTNSQLSTAEPKKQTKQTRRGTESQKWRSHGGLPVRRGRGEESNGSKGTGNKKHKW